jgi:hypothetical protein
MKFPDGTLICSSLKSPSIVLPGPMTSKRTGRNLFGGHDTTSAVGVYEKVTGNQVLRYRSKGKR